MKTNTAPNGQRQSGGFTLIEMIGVLAVIAILAALLLPKVANAINDSKIQGLVGSYQGLQAAETAFYGKYLSLNSTNNPPAAVIPTAAGPLLNYDTTALLANGYLDHAFNSKIGTNAVVQCSTGGANGSAEGCANGLGYYLSGGSSPDTTNMQYVVEIKIQGVLAADAYAVSQAVDGTGALTPASLATEVSSGDQNGKVVFQTTANSGIGTMYLFVDGR